MGRPSAARVSGPLRALARGFLVELLERGYAWTAVAARLRLMAELSCWLAARGVGPRELTPSLVEEFLESARACERGKPWCSPTSERQLLAYLRGVGVAVPPPVLPASDPAERLVGEFVEYLVRERGLAVGTTTVYEYERIARLFLSGRLDRDGGGLERLAAGDVMEFVLAECRRRSVRMSRALVTSLRGLLRFLYLEGATATDSGPRSH
jgi:integrase/recombinase XerD